MTDASVYPSFVNPDFTHVSPVTFSDGSTLNKSRGVPQINAKGFRRGLIAFKIIAVGVDVDENGSVLPELVIEIVDPATLAPSNIKPATQQGGGGKPMLVQSQQRSLPASVVDATSRRHCLCVPILVG